MLCDEDYVLGQATLLTLQQATETQASKDKLHASEIERGSGAGVEVDIAAGQLRDWQLRIRAAPADIDVVLTKLASGSSKVSLSPAGELYARHESEQKVVRGVVALKERALASARRNLEVNELALMRADLERQIAAAIVLAVKHLEVEKVVHSADPSIEVPLGNLLTEAIDSIVNLQQLIARKERERGPQ
jgi:hypothetical protein